MTKIGFTRRTALQAIGASAGVALAARAGYAAQPGKPSANEALSESAVLRDPAVTVGGNPDGDISIVEWFDYQCPYCRKLAPDLDKLVRDDGQLRMVYKDWPVLGPESMLAAKLVLAARFQDKYLAAHQAMIAATGRLTESGIRDRLAAAGVDLDRAVRDSEAKSDDIKSVIVRNDMQAKAFGFEGTPSFIVGKFRIAQVLTVDEFKLAIADARKAAKASKAPARKI